jgi:hypothetical protein
VRIGPDTPGYISPRQLDELRERRAMRHEKGKLPKRQSRKKMDRDFMRKHGMKSPR